jgi:hypothetical protein
MHGRRRYTRVERNASGLRSLTGWYSRQVRSHARAARQKMGAWGVGGGGSRPRSLPAPRARAPPCASLRRPPAALRGVKSGEGKHTVAVPEQERVRVEREDLRIVPEPLWKTVQKRKATLFATYRRTAKGRLQGRPETSLDAKHLLAGFCVRSECGGRLVVWNGRGARAKYRYLVCWRHRSSSAGACGNGRNVPLQPLTDAIVSHFTKGVLTAEAIAQVAADLAADADASPERVAAQRQGIETELALLAGRIARWTDAIGDGGVRSLVERIKEAEAHQDALRVRLAQLNDTQAMIAKWTEAGHQDRVEALLSDWQGALEGSPVVGRQILKKLLVGPILVTSWMDPETKQVAHSYEAEGTYGRAISRHARGRLGPDPVERGRQRARRPPSRAEGPRRRPPYAGRSGGRCSIGTGAAASRAVTSESLRGITCGTERRAARRPCRTWRYSVVAITGRCTRRAINSNECPTGRCSSDGRTAGCCPRCRRRPRCPLTQWGHCGPNTLRRGSNSTRARGLPSGWGSGWTWAGRSTCCIRGRRGPSTDARQDEIRATYPSSVTESEACWNRLGPRMRAVSRAGQIRRHCCSGSVMASRIVRLVALSP